MHDCTTNLLSYLRQALGVPLGAIPLCACHIQKPYLLEKHHLSTDGTAILFAVPYLVTQDVYDPHRNISLYAVPKDYHLYFEFLSKKLLPVLHDLFTPYHFALFSDHSPILEVDAAAKCGLGKIGDHGLLITEAYGTFVFLGELITDMPWQTVVGSETPFQPKEITHCEGCGACISACPAQCLPGTRDTCISALSQKKGALTDVEKDLFCSQSLIWGCDACQLACPHNQKIIEAKLNTQVAYFLNDRICHLNEDILHHMSEDFFKTRAYAWRGKNVICRNLTLLNERRQP